MTSHCGRFKMVYNGEVYNYKEIAIKLRNINWKTSSDSEVILEAFVAWGVNFVYQLNGMFAIAIYDKKEDKLFLFRDRMGIKPLYYYKYHEDFIFASEIKAINKLNIKKQLDHESIYSYLHIGYVVSNKTIFKNFYKVPKGSYLICDGKILISKNIGVLNTYKKIKQ